MNRCPTFSLDDKKNRFEETASKNRGTPESAKSRKTLGWEIFFSTLVQNGVSAKALAHVSKNEFKIFKLIQIMRVGVRGKCQSVTQRKQRRVAMDFLNRDFVFLRATGS